RSTAVDRRAPGSAGLPAGPDALQDPRHLPTVFYTNTGYEYWGRAGSLLHTSLDGSADVETLPKVRIYHLAGAQHFVDAFPPDDDRRVTGEGEPPAWRGNPMDFLPNLRALAVAMTEHLAEGTAPPPGRHPRIDEGTLGPLSEAEEDFPAIPGLAFPEVVHVAYRADYGPRWPEGVVTEQPPGLGPAFPSLVPRLDALGNEVGGVRNVALRVPLATYTPWSLRTGLPGPEHELADFRGTFAPLPWDEAEKRATGDPRPAVTSLYDGRDDYLERARAAARALVREGFLLEEDVDRVVGRAAELWDWREERAGDGG
ncbi:MAG: alpha/beta hydrolase domain-containing protein, partial [Gemmatimonadota bacterium]